jgi:indole-3-glycerol phosphate synthase
MNDLSILDRIVHAKQIRLATIATPASRGQVREAAYRIRAGVPNHRFRAELLNDDRINVIAEIKRASPSKGVISENLNVEERARTYEDAGAAAISVLTEEDFFSGSLADLRHAISAVSVPVLRKDFVVDEYQIYEAAAAGAEAVLLIAAILDDWKLSQYRSIAEDELGIDALIEVHDKAELFRARDAGANMIGVNNRDLRTFNVSLDISKELVEIKPEGCLMVSESGLSKRAQILELHSLGFAGFLIGEALMKADRVGEELRSLTTPTPERAPL